MVQCQCKTKEGKQCSRNATEGNLCKQHAGMPCKDFISATVVAKQKSPVKQTPVKPKAPSPVNPKVPSPVKPKASSPVKPKVNSPNKSKRLSAKYVEMPIDEIDEMDYEEAVEYIKTNIDPETLDLSVGDIINFSTDRHLHSYIMGVDGKLIANPDYSAAGYLSIPAAITRHISDPMPFYNKILEEEIMIEFDATHPAVIKRFGEPLPDTWTMVITVDDYGKEAYMMIQMPGDKFFHVDINAKTYDDMIQAFYKKFDTDSKERKAYDASRPQKAITVDKTPLKAIETRFDPKRNMTMTVYPYDENYKYGPDALLKKDRSGRFVIYVPYGTEAPTRAPQGLKNVLVTNNTEKQRQYDEIMRK